MHNVGEVTGQVREAVAEVLGRPAAEVRDEENLISAGLDSIRAMSLLGRWRAEGAELDYRDLTRTPTVAAWSALLLDRLPSATAGSGPGHPAGTEADGDDEDVPVLDEAAAFPLTPVQQAYWIGRRDGRPLGGNGCHAYIEFDGGGIVPERLEAAVRAVIRRHGMLRARFLEDGTQRIGDASSWPGLTVHDLREAPPERVTAELLALRERLSHRRFRVEEGDLFDVQLSLLPQGATRIHFDIDLLVADVLSIQLLLTDVARHYGRPQESADAPSYTFPRYLADLAGRRGPARERARQYWQERLHQLPAGPALPLRAGHETLEGGRFSRRAARLSPDAWQRFTERSRAHGVTPAMALATAYAEVLGAFSGRRRFLLNLPLFDRQPLHPDAGALVADFTNLLLLTVDTCDPVSFGEQAKRVQQQFQSDAAHAEYSAVEVLRDLARVRPDDGITAPVVFASNLGGSFVGEEFREHLGEFGWMLSQTPQVWLDHQVYEDAGELLLTWDAIDDLFPAGVLDAMFGAYEGLIRALADDDASWSEPVGPLVPEEQLRVRQRVNDTRAPESGKLLHEAVVETASRHGDRIALRWGDDGSMTYGELLGRARAVASALHAERQEPGEPVAVLLDKGWEQVVAVLGVLLAGASYLPVETYQPALRRDAVLADARVRTAVVHSSSPARSSLPQGIRTVSVDRLPPSPEGSTAPETSGADGDDMAYVIYTSGSTGSPKGVMISHRSAVNTVEDVNRRFGVGEGDRVLGLAGLGFDLSVYDVFGPLSVGGCLVLPEAERRSDPSRWAELVARHEVTVWNSVPAQLQMLQDHLESEPARELPSLRLALLSGDWIPVSLPDAVRGRLPGLELVSLGGATEAAIWSIHHPIGGVPDHWTSIPYGTPLGNQSFDVVDEAMRPRPDWTPGELCIGGTGVAMGYLGDERRTAERFVRHPVSGRRLYRTGDVGRYLPDGTIEFLGRADQQLKIRGHRIEPAEVEAALLAHPHVQSALAVLDRSGAGEGRIVAVVTAPAGQDCLDIDLAGLFTHLAERLPGYMMPSFIETIDALPLTANGKVDRAAVLALVAEAGETENDLAAQETAPRDELEQRIAAVWEALLGVRVASRERTFHAMGGDSLLVARSVGRLRQELPEARAVSFDDLLRTMFAEPTVAAVGARLREHGRGGAPDRETPDASEAGR